jgi:hypothetical protein
LRIRRSPQRRRRATGLDDRDELPWLEYDNAGNSIHGQIEPDLLEAWLFKTVSDDRLENWGSHTASQYAPGFEIINSLDATDSRSLGLHEVDLGGPASSVPCVAITASIDEFNQMIRARGLPYVMVDDEGPIER